MSGDWWLKQFKVNILATIDALDESSNGHTCTLRSQAVGAKYDCRQNPKNAYVYL